MVTTTIDPIFTKLIEAHDLKVRLISARVKSFHTSKTPFRIYHGSTNSTRPTIRDPATSIDTSNLNSVLSVSKANKLAIVEPNVPMDVLVRECLKEGLIPPVIPEFPGITVGGGFAGTAGESSSWKYGFLDATVESIEIITGDGEVRKANAGGRRADGSVVLPENGQNEIVGTQGENEELFYGAAGTLGTLGVLTRLDIRLIDAKSHVKLTYMPVYSYKEAVDGIKLAVERASLTETNSDAGTNGSIKRDQGWDKDEFIEAIMFSPTSGAVVTGSMVDFPREMQGKGKAAKEVTFSKRWDEWYYLHVQKRIKTKGKTQPANKTETNNNVLLPADTTPPKESSTPKEASSFEDGSNQENSAIHPTTNQPIRTVAPSTLPISDFLTDYIPLQDYLFRYDRGGFWVGRLAFSYFQQPFTRFGRWLYDPFLHTRTMYHALHESGLSTKYIVEDLAVPFMGSAKPPVLSAEAETGKTPGVLTGSESKEEEDKTNEVQETNVKNEVFKEKQLTSKDVSSGASPTINPSDTDLSPAENLLLYLEKSFYIFPLWLCPLRLHPMGLKPKHINPSVHPILLNVGVWGPYPSTTTFTKANKEIEREMYRLGGTKWLYAHTFYTQEEFWSIYDKAGYDELRRKYGAEYLPDVWDKVKAKESDDEDNGKKKTLRQKVKGFWVFAGLYGIFKVLSSKDYILKKRKTSTQ